jgi:hypothetical protein
LSPKKYPFPESIGFIQIPMRIPKMISNENNKGCQIF